MKVLFLYPSWTSQYGLFAHFARKAGVYPPLNLALLAALTEREGHEAKIIDAEAEQIPFANLIQHAVEYAPDLIGVTCTTPFYHFTKELIRGLRQANLNAPIAIGGPHFTIMREAIFTEEIDFGFIGEGDLSWPWFLKKFERGEDFSDVPGLMFRRNGKVMTTGAPIFNDELDRLPFPARHLLPMDRYVLGTIEGRKKFTSIQTIRGCPWDCIYCASEALNTKRMAKRSIESSVNEIMECVTKYDVQHFMFVDDELTLDRDHILGICDCLQKERLPITFEGNTRANLIDEELIDRMRKAGLIRMSFGLETVDEKIRTIIKKKVPLEAYEKANKILNRHGIEALNSVMLGLPGETKETVYKTLDFLSSAKEVKQANFAIAVPYPGTEFHEMAKSGQHGLQLMSDDFSKYLRYNSAVTKVNELSPDDLIELQNEGFVRIYSAPWRWIPMIRKFGILGAVLTFSRILKILSKKVFRTKSIPNEKKEVYPKTPGRIIEEVKTR